jgi:hypothetical protein
MRFLLHLLMCWRDLIEAISALFLFDSQNQALDGIAEQSNLPPMPAAKPVRIDKPIKFDDAMRRAMRVPPPPCGKKAQRKVWKKKRR